MPLRPIVAAMITSVACALNAHARTETIAVQGEQAHGLPAGVLFGDDFSLPVISNGGDVAYRANLTGIGIAADNDEGLWHNSILEVRKGDPAPDTPAGVLFSSLGDPLVDRIGRITHLSSLTGTDVVASNDMGIWREDFMIAREGEQAHGMDLGVVFADDGLIWQPAVHDEFGRAVYLGRVTGTDIDGSNKFGIWDSTSLEVRLGDPAPGTDPGVVFGGFGVPASGGGGVIAHNSFLTGTGVSGTNNEGIWRNTTLIAREGDPAPGTPAGVVFSSLGEPSMNSAQVVHRSFLTGTGVDSDNDRGIWVGDTLIAREGSQAPGLPEGVKFRTLGDPVINDLGQVAHQSDLQTSGLIGFGNNEGIWRDDTIIAQEGGPAGGVPGAVFSGILGEPVINNIGIVAHNSLMDSFVGGTGSNNEGIWLADGIDQVLAVREGDVLEGKAVQSLTLNGVFDPATMSDGRGTPLNDRGELTFLATFDDSTKGIFKFTPTLHWRSTAPGGDWDDAQNWTLGILPTFIHDVVIDPDHDVNLDGPDISAFYRPDSVTVGGGGGMATVSVRSNTFDPDAPLTVNYNGHLIIRDTASVTTNGIDLGTIAATPLDAPATLTGIGPTADINISDTINVGVNAPAVLNITNGTYAFTIDLNVGVSGQGALNVLTGADAEADNGATLGQDPGSTGTLNVDGSGSTILFSSMVFAGVSGNAHINATNGGAINADDGINLATNDTSISTIKVQGPTTTLNTGGLSIGDAGHATVTIQDGALLDLTANTRLGIGATGNGTLIVTGPGTTLDARGVEAGINGTGSVVLANGATATSNDVVLGQSPTAEGSLTLSGPGTTWSAGITLIATMGGTGNFRVENGAAYTATFLTTFIGSGTGSVGTATVTGSGSTFSATGPLTLGSSGGTGTLNLIDGGLASFGGTTTINTGSAIHLNGGTFNALALAGTGDIHLHAGTLNITNNTMIDAKLFDANLTLGPDTAINVTNDATIDNLINATIDGGTLSANTLTNDGTLAVHAGLVSADSKLINNAAVLLGNPVTARITTPSFDNFGDLAGAGRITGDLSNTGTIDPTTGTLRIDGNATNNATGIVSLTGGQLRATGAFTNATNALVIGNGTLRADGGINNQSKANMAFSGPTNIIGDVTNNPIATIVSSGPGPLTFFDDVVNDGEIRTTTGGFTVFLGTTSGSGSYTGTGTVVYEADFTPGSSPGINNFGSDVVFGPFSTLHIEAQGPSPTPVPGVDHDQINITGNVTLSGTLDVDLLLPGTPPPLGVEFEVMTFADRLGTMFDAIAGTLINSSFALAPLFTDTDMSGADDALILQALVPGDIDGNLAVNVSDLAVFALNFGTTPGLYDEVAKKSSWRFGDFNADGIVSVADLSLLALNFGFALNPDGTTTPPTPLSLADAASLVGLDISTIPEPATATLVLIPFTVAHLIRRRPSTPAA